MASDWDAWECSGRPMPKVNNFWTSHRSTVNCLKGNAQSKFCIMLSHQHPCRLHTCCFASGITSNFRGSGDDYSSLDFAELSGLLLLFQPWDADEVASIACRMLFNCMSGGLCRPCESDRKFDLPFSLNFLWLATKVPEQQLCAPDHGTKADGQNASASADSHASCVLQSPCQHRGARPDGSQRDHSGKGFSTHDCCKFC
eukprot:scaffold257306_cov17-Prasinocladus_malaysianus.AAC.1